MKYKRGKWRWKPRRCSGQLLVRFSNRHWIRRMDMKIGTFILLSLSREVIKPLVGIFISRVWRTWLRRDVSVAVSPAQAAAESWVQGAENPSGHRAAWERGMDLWEREVGSSQPFWKKKFLFCLLDFAARVKKQTKPAEENPPSTRKTFAKELSESWCQQHVLHSGQRNGCSSELLHQ